MKVTYTGKMDIGGSGIGTTAWHQVKPLLDNNLIEQIYTTKMSKPVNDDRLVTYIPELKYSYPIGYLAGDIFFDGVTALGMENPEVIHTWGAQCLYQLQTHPDAVSIVNLYSAHPYIQDQLLKNSPLYRPNHLHMKKFAEELELCDHIFIPSDFILSSLKDVGLHRKAKIVPFGVDLEKFNVPKNNEKAEEFQVVFVGSNWKRKGLMTLLQAWDNLKFEKAKLYVCGVPDNLGAWLKENTPFESDNVHFGWVDDLVELYQKSHVFCLPAYEDGCPLATYEAMACGTLPIITNTTGTRQHVYNGRNGFVLNAGNVKELGELLSGLYDDSLGKT